MLKTEIVAEIARRTKLRADVVNSVLNNALGVILQELSTQGSIKISSVGSLQVKEQPARKRYIPLFKEERFTPAKKVVKLKLSKGAKQYIAEADKIPLEDRAEAFAKAFPNSIGKTYNAEFDIAA